MITFAKTIVYSEIILDFYEESSFGNYNESMRVYQANNDFKLMSFVTKCKGHYEVTTLEKSKWQKMHGLRKCGVEKPNKGVFSMKRVVGLLYRS